MSFVNHRPVTLRSNLGKFINYSARIVKSTVSWSGSSFASFSLLVWEMT